MTAHSFFPRPSVVMAVPGLIGSETPIYCRAYLGISHMLFDYVTFLESVGALFSRCVFIYVCACVRA